MGKKKILYYTDCPFFAGCENMIANFLNSEELSKEFDIKLIYRYSEQYEEGAKKRIKDLSKCEGIQLFTETSQKSYVTSDVKLIAFLQKCLWAVVYIFNKYNSMVKNSKTLQRKISEYEPDIIHINNGGYPASASAQAAVLAAHKCGVKQIYYVVNNMAMNYSHPSRWLDIFVDSYVKRYVTYFITGSDNAGRHLMKTLKLPEYKQKTIRNGIVQRNTTMSVSQFKNMFSIPNDSVVFSTIANLEERKGHIYLLKAIKELRDDNRLKDVVFVLEGKGPKESLIKEYISNNQLNDYIKLIAVPAIYDLYAASDVVILPSISNEDFPNIIIESMGMGIPVIGTRIAGIPEQIIPEVTGLLVDPANVVQLKEAIIMMLEDSTIRKEYGSNAKDIFKRNYTAEHSVEEYIKIYKKEIL